MRSLIRSNNLNYFMVYWKTSTILHFLKKPNPPKGGDGKRWILRGDYHEFN
jgi:hypothetical protein